jgi:hypothetical protein
VLAYSDRGGPYFAVNHVFEEAYLPAARMRT